MIRSWQRWNNASRKWLWLLVVVGIVASLPVIYQRVQTESSAKKVEFVFNYRGLLEISALKENPAAFIDEQLDKLKEARISTMAVFESTLDELTKARRIMVFNASDVAKMNQSVVSDNGNQTYIAFTSSDNEQQLRPIIEKAFEDMDVSVKPWTYGEHAGLVLGMAPEEAVLKSMQPDPIAIAKLQDKGFNILPRMSDTIRYNQDDVDELLAYYEQIGVKRILFDGDAVKGYSDNEAMNSLEGFAELLKKHNIGLITIENLKAPQKGLNKLAF